MQHYGFATISVHIMQMKLSSISPIACSSFSFGKVPSAGSSIGLYLLTISPRLSFINLSNYWRASGVYRGSKYYYIYDYELDELLPTLLKAFLKKLPIASTILI